MKVDRLLEQMRTRLGRSKPVRMTVAFADGSTVATDYGGALAIARDRKKREGVTNITANRPDYAAAAGIMAVLCHPAPNRRIEDYA